MFILEKRPTPSRFWMAATPVLAVVLTMIAGGLMFAILGKDPFEAILRKPRNLNLFLKRPRPELRGGLG